VKNKFGKKAAKKRRETFVFSGLSVRNLKKNAANIYGLKLHQSYFSTYFDHLDRLCITKNEYFRAKTETNLSINFNSPQSFTPARVQFFSEILRKKSFSKVKNTSYFLSEEKNNIPVNCTIHKCKSNEYYSSNKENKPKI
jgi:hypothetical protein